MKKKFLVLLVLLGMIISLVPVQSFAVGESYYALNDYNADASLLSVETCPAYPWQIYNDNPNVLISTNKGIDSSVSLLKVSVQGAGALSYDYRVYSGTTDDEAVPDALLVKIGAEITAKTARKDVDREFYGVTGWRSDTIEIHAADDATTDVYFAYKKNGSGNYSNDVVLLRNLSFNNGRTQITAVSSDANYGTVTGGGEYYATSPVTLTAIPAAGGKFMGWQENGLLLDNTGATLSFIAGIDRSITAIFGSATATVAQNHRTGCVYSDLPSAFAAAADGDVIILVGDATLSSNVTVPTGLTLYVPYSAEYDADGSCDGTASDSSSAFATENKTFRRLTISAGTTLTVEGKLLIGGTIGYPGTFYQGHTSGWHGRVTNNGTIAVNGGEINCYGYIDGSGTVDAASGIVLEPFVVYDFAGGNNTLDLWNAGQNPFAEYTMQNISCTLSVHSAAILGAYCNLYASSEYNKTTAYIYGGRDLLSNGVVLLNEGSVLTRTVDTAKSVKNGIGGAGYAADIYPVTYELSGGAELGYMDMEIYGFDVSVGRVPVTYAARYLLTNGEYTMTKDWCVLPGGELNIADNASLTVFANLYVTDGLINSGMSGRFYPSSETLAGYGFATNGILMVNGELEFAPQAAFGGVAQTDGTGRIVVSTQAVTATPAFQHGAIGYYDDNTCVMPLNARAWNGSELVNLAPGFEYDAQSGEGWTMEGYSVTEYASAVTSVTEPASGMYTKPSNGNFVLYGGETFIITNQAMNGTFLQGAVVDDAPDDVCDIIIQTYADPSDTPRAQVSNLEISNGSATFTVERTAIGNAYNFLVQYKKGDGSPVTLNAVDSVFRIPDYDNTVSVVVTCVMRGDAFLDGELSNKDIIYMKKLILGTATFTDMTRIASDVFLDGEISNKDIILLKKIILGTASY